MRQGLRIPGRPDAARADAQWRLRTVEHRRAGPARGLREGDQPDDAVTNVNREPTARFSDRVNDYIRYRPGYPVEVVRTLEHELGIRADRTRVVDIGSGTGISADLFLREGYAVVG